MTIKNRLDLIKAYIKFFKLKNHKEIPNSSLIPENDPSVLFTTAGMHPLVPFLLGQLHPQGKRLVNNQKCIRTGDIDKVGDDFHLTFFEMLGNWSLGDYWKEESVILSFQFLTKILKIPKEKISITCFKGDKDAPKDNESAKIWKSLGIKEIKFLGKKENWWGPAGKTGPCGPDTEIFVNKFEIWNNVFMEFNQVFREGTWKRGNKEKYKEPIILLIPLKQKNVDTGMGVERTLAVLLNKKSVYEIPSIKKIKDELQKTANIKKLNKQQEKSLRIITDHLRAAVFILAEKISPSNVERGYVLRRLVRKVIRHGNLLKIKNNFTEKIAKKIIGVYKDYEHLKKNEMFILQELKKEEEKFSLTLEKGLNKFEKITQDKILGGKEAFLLYQSYGFPIELIQELCKEKKIKLNIKDYKKELKKHQKLSRTATKGKFKSGLADKSEQTKKLHTASHLLIASLRKLISNKIEQRGSNVNPERLRLDFNFDRKLTEEEVKKVEDLVNKKIKEAIPVIRKEGTLEDAKKAGCLGVFEDKYGPKVSYYIIGDFSKEICTGPHVKNTKELGRFKIIKQKSVSAGVRRIRAVLE